MAGDVEEILGPIHEDGYRYVVTILGERYGVKRWTLFEASKYEHRIKEGRVIPIFSCKLPQTAFDPMLKRGGRTWDPDGDLKEQAEATAKVISEKLNDRT